MHEEGVILKVNQYPHYFQAINEFHNITAKDVFKHQATSELTETYFKPKNIHSLMDVPIWLEGELVGVLCHEHSKIRDWTLEDQEFAASIVHMISLMVETFQRKKVEKELRASLKEKEILMKEIHHRVKNNLTVISSLLNLQSYHIKDEKALNFFKESQDRAKSMALIHEKLYGADDLRKIDFSDYLRTLTSELFNSYNLSPGISLNMEIDKLDIDVNTSVPLALIVNEIVSNSLKHGFKDKDNGNIWINFYKKDQEYELIVEDDGVGFSDNLDFKKTESFGMQIVNSLTQQLNGKISMEKTEGTRFILNFKDKFYQEDID
jgi:two-component sensor histidine kinase